MLNGIININKKEGVNSTKLVSRLKWLSNKTPCGHMGTLDPMATGVLPIGVGRATRLFDYLLGKDKIYLANFKFGITTDTLDTTGKILDTTSKITSLKVLENVLPDFLGEIEQIPPKYSACSVNGQRGYALARKGIDFQLKPKTIKIKNLEILSQIAENEFEIKIDCGAGTYIRSLARDIAEKMGTLGVMSKLTRLKSGMFKIEDSVDIDEVTSYDIVEKMLIKTEDVIELENIMLTDKETKKMLDGIFSFYPKCEGKYKVYSPYEFLGIGEIKDSVLKITTYLR